MAGSTDDTKNPFLLGQTFAQLNPQLSVNQRRQHVCGRMLPDMNTTREKPDVDSWLTCSRSNFGQQLLVPQPAKRVGLVCDAGLGKSTNMAWLASLIARTPGCQQIPLLLHLDDANAGHLELLEQEARKPGTILDELGSRLRHRLPGFIPTDQELSHLQQAGQMTLLIDGLDHALTHPRFIANLKVILESACWVNCPIWIAGRPYAFDDDDGWQRLFADSDWHFWRVNPLAEAEIRQYLSYIVGVDIYDELRHSHHLLAVPRLLNLIAGIVRRRIPIGANEAETKQTIADLDLRTPADVYDKAYFDEGTTGEPNTYGLLRQGLQGEAERFGLDDDEDPSEMNVGDRINAVADLVGAIAFLMLEGSSSTSPSPNTDGLTRDELRNALHPKRDSYGLGSKGKCDAQLQLLRRMNNRLFDYLLFRDAGDKRFVFYDRTVQAFFAARWTMRKGIPSDLTTIQRWAGITAYAEFWQFAAQLPDRLVDQNHWHTFFAAHYAPPPIVQENERTPWQREMIYHSFRRMSQRAPQSIFRWRQGFIALATGTTRQQRIYREITEGFCEIPAGDCHFGADPIENEKGIILPVLAFRLHRYQVTNEMYEEFAPSHQSARWYGEQHPLATQKKKTNQNDDRCPVVNLTWYDAWCFAAWCGFCLPTEQQWEHACRAGTATRFHFGDKEADLPQYAWFDVNSKHSTHPVGELKPNPHGLFDMHGNVWEWCDSLNEPGASARVLRGGGWDCLGRRCRSALRSWCGPGIRNWSIGFRLAAVPAVGAKSSKTGG